MPLRFLPILLASPRQLHLRVPYRTVLLPALPRSIVTASLYRSHFLRGFEAFARPLGYATADIYYAVIITALISGDCHAMVLRPLISALTTFRQIEAYLLICRYVCRAGLRRGRLLKRS